MPKKGIHPNLTPMRLLKIILVFIAIYFIRRFIQMYRVMKAIQEKQMAEAAEAQKQQHNNHSQTTKVVDADFKVID